MTSLKIRGALVSPWSGPSLDTGTISRTKLLQLKFIDNTFQGSQVVPCLQRTDGENDFYALSTGMRMLLKYCDTQPVLDNGR
jgi:hypothetical protein